MQEFRVVHKNEGLTAPQLVNRGAEQWKDMTEEDKQPYVERSLRAREELAERAERAAARVGNRNSALDAGIDSAKARLAKVMGLKAPATGTATPLIKSKSKDEIAATPFAAMPSFRVTK